MDDAERDKRLTALRDDLGRLEPEGVIEQADDEITVRAKTARGAVATLRFMFTDDGKLDGIAVEVK